jgi:DNA-binding transcriptional MerR regulator
MDSPLPGTGKGKRKAWSILHGQGVSMQIGELAQRTGLSHDTIRFYEKRGLIETSHWKRLDNGYKDYSVVVIDRLSLIKMAKQLGFPLTEIQKLIVRWETGQIPRTEKLRLLVEKIGQIDTLIDELNRNKAFLAEKVAILRQNED